MVFQEPMTALNPLHTIGRQIGESLRLHRGMDAGAARRACGCSKRVQLPQAAAPTRRLSAPAFRAGSGSGW